jgi:hypothetical protein
MEIFFVRPISNGTDNVPNNTTYTWSNPVVSPAGFGKWCFGTIFQWLVLVSFVNVTANPATVTYTVSPNCWQLSRAYFTVTVTVNPLINVETIKRVLVLAQIMDRSVLLFRNVPYKSGAPYLFSWTGPNGFTSTSANITKTIRYKCRMMVNVLCEKLPSSRARKFSFSGFKMTLALKKRW